MRVGKADFKRLMQSKKKRDIKKKIPDAWFPNEIHLSICHKKKNG
jgi:hypothetical protein